MESTTEENSETSGSVAKSRRIGLWVFAAVAVVFTSFLLFDRGEKVPEYEGTPVSKYLADMARWRGQPEYEVAVRVIKSVGTNGLPYYVREGYGPRPKYQTCMLDMHERYQNSVTDKLNGWINSDYKSARRKGARDAIRFLSYPIESSPITNELAEAMQLANTRDVFEIAELIDAYGGNSAAAVVPWLEEPSRTKTACWVISECGERGTNAIPALVALFKSDKHHNFTEDIFKALRKMRQFSRPAFGDALMSGDDYVRLLALEYVRPDPGMIDNVVPLLSDPNPEVQFKAAMAIMGWRLWARNNFKLLTSDEVTSEHLVKVFELESGRDAFHRIIEGNSSEVKEVNKIPVATVYCLYGGSDERFMEFLQQTAKDDSNRSRQLAAGSALKSIRAFRQEPGVDVE